MSQNIRLFQFLDNKGNFQVRTIQKNGKIYFAGSDVAKALGYARPTKAVQDHCKVKGVLKWDTLTNGGKQKLKFINEGNVYRLIMRSKKKRAERFEEWVVDEVLPEIRKMGSYNSSLHIPLFIKRANLNYDKVPIGHFSVINQLYIELYGRFERLGYMIADKAENGVEIQPDKSVGKSFANYLRIKYPDIEHDFDTYEHVFLSGVKVRARYYPDELLKDFREHVYKEWIPNRAFNYFETRDPKALDFLPKLLPEKVS